ncbi:MAG: phosphotransferase [Candidatus Latescibacteria bacterium]|nr:phosphotransferase [Candidatus Latescibacterota bacterium]
MNRLFSTRPITSAEQTSWYSSIDKAERLVCAKSQTPVTISPIEILETPLGPIKHIVRCHLKSSPNSNSVIVKDISRRDSQPFDPLTTDRFSASYRFFSDCACLQFLSTDLEVRSCPNLVAFDKDVGLLVLEDLGDEMSVLAALSGQSSEGAKTELRRLAESLAEIQGRSIGREEEYRNFREGLGPGYEQVSVQDRRFMEKELPAVWSICDQLGLDVKQAQQDVERVLEALSDPGEYLALLHRDVIPPNFLSVENRLCVFDFEFAGYGHGLVDIAQVRMGFPTYGLPAMIPKSVVRATEQIYQERFTFYSELKVLRHPFEKALTEATCFWALFELVGSLQTAMDEMHDQSVQRCIRLRARLKAFSELSNEVGHLEHMATLSMAITEQIGIRRKVSEELAEFPAFSQQLH